MRRVRRIGEDGILLRTFGGEAFLLDEIVAECGLVVDAIGFVDSVADAFVLADAIGVLGSYSKRVGEPNVKRRLALGLGFGVVGALCVGLIVVGLFEFCLAFDFGVWCCTGAGVCN